jgi:signal transduction histidine kinase
VNEEVKPRGEEGAGGWLESVCKLIVTLRVGILLVTLLALRDQGDRQLLIAAILVAGLASFLPLRYWDRVGPSLVRHPAWLAAEIVLTALILVLTGIESPFFYYTLGTALLGGLLYGAPGALVFSPILVGVYIWAIDARSDFDPVPHNFQTLIGQPALYIIVAAAGVATRNLLDRMADYEGQIADQERRAASEAERTSLARDLHDSLAKSVAGIGFGALALARKIEHDPEGAKADARRLADDAREATREAREIIVALRGDVDDGTRAALPQTLLEVARRWSASSGIPVETSIEDVGQLHPVAARELEWILREALGNVLQHANATRVGVHLRAFGSRAVLTIADDGRGFEMPEDGAEAPSGHFGLTGMRERAQLAGGELAVESAPGEGCVVSAWVAIEAFAPEALPQAQAPAEPVAPAPAPPVAPEPVPAPPAADDASLPRPVPGFTWQ